MIVVIDNYDSFTYNLVQYFKQLEKNVLVYQNDKITVKQIAQLDPDLIVLSPGPGTPKESGISNAIISELHQRIPILGVCLGFQVIVEFFGGTIIKGIQPMHGKVTSIEHDQRGVFATIKSPTKVTRYHSLIAKAESIPAQLEISSHAVDGTIMGVRHRTFPVEGIQFHPESITTENGFQMIKNSYEQALLWKRKRGETKHEPLSSF